MTNFYVKIIIKKIFLIILAAAGYIMLLPFWPNIRKNKLVILRYHSVSDLRRHEVNVKVANFRKQMRLLRSGYRLISLKEALNLIRERSSFPKNTVAVTFDDGYRDNYTNALSIIREFNIPVTIFLISGYIGTDRILPHDAGDEPGHNYLLSWEDVKVMQKEGIEFGSHTLNHANLGQGRYIDDEIVESKKVIDKELDTETLAISYPFGLLKDFNQRVKDKSREAGYTCGCSAMNGTNDYRTDAFELKRIGIEASDNMFTFRAKLNGALDLLIVKDKPLFNGLLNVFNRLIGV